MGGFFIKTQPFGVYQAIDWLQPGAELENQITGVRRIRTMLDQKRSEDVVKLNIVSRLVELLESTSSAALQAEITWTLGNIAAGKSSHTELVLHKSLPVFMKLLESAQGEVPRSDIIWAFAKIAGDSPKCRDILLSSGIVETTLKLLEAPATLQLEINCIWLLSQVFRHRRAFPEISISIIVKCLPVIIRSLSRNNIEILEHACWGLKYISDGKANHIDAIIAAGACKPIVTLLGHSSSTVIYGALLVCINISSGSHTQTQALVGYDIVAKLSQLMESDDKTVLKNVCFTLSNIAAGTREQMKMLFEAKIFSKLRMVYDKSDAATQIDVMHLIRNTLCIGTYSQTMHLVSQCGMILNQGLTSENEDLLKLSLECLIQTKSLCAIDEREIIVKLRKHKNASISSLACELARVSL